MRAFRPALAAALLLLPLAARAQESGFPATAPPDLPVRPFNLPKIESRTLSNGLKVVVAESHRVPIVTMRLGVQAGSVLDPADEPGLAAATANQLTSGSDRYTSLQINEAAENLGGSINASAGDDFATVSATALSDNAEPLLELLADVLLHPTFPESELQVYKSLTLQRLVVQRQNPSFLAREQLARRLYGSHPYAVVAPTPAAVQGLNRQKLEDFYKAHYKPGGAVLTVVGDIKASTIFGLIERALGEWSGGGATAASNPLPAPPAAETIYLVNRPGSVQSNILFGNPARKQGDPDEYALAVANTILGSGASSRLFNDVRERLGYAYDVGSAVSAQAQAGEFVQNAQTRSDVTAPALKEMLAEESRLRSQPPTEAELQAAKNLINGIFVMRLVSQSGLADRLLAVEMYHLQPDYLATYRDRINAVTAADVQRAAQKYMTPDKQAIVIVGDADKVRAALQAIATVEDVK